MNHKARIWKRSVPPKRVLAIRLQAMGDLVITLPYLQALRDSLPPGTQLDLLTRQEVAAIPQHLHLFNRVFAIGGGRVFKRQFLYAIFLLPRLMLRRYDVVLDLQNNKLSRMVRLVLRPRAWTEFDRLSPISAGLRNQNTIAAVGLGNHAAAFHLCLREPVDTAGLLRRNGWDGVSGLVVLNPAGAFATRHWPVENYVSFARQWLQHFPQTQFLVIGVPLVAEKATFFQRQLGGRLINLVSKTTPVEAFALLQQVRLTLTEDSGLMHMSWVQGIATLALFGSTRSDWSAPLGRHSLLLHSGDLPCGSCMREQCLHGNTPCLTRYTPEQVLAAALALVAAATAGA
ncbi:ADP-heptose:LPS heptosyltransferase [Filimonas lacunae]|uniref:ADP-heptose:LPS heptosyltransferase n=1 Tax=Filimonas lacunae TaxID=477680 RepID=A0A1N7R2J8_9BACT|nr:glycosyltransferase family 9 protein [Filimonas lacunae]SIT29351.1 ADP-heptose:LPS heptosyltransferase [Filimonas lacunae]